MTQSLDRFFKRTYKLGVYDCRHLTAEVWKHLTSTDIAARLDGVLDGVTRAHVAGFQRLQKPINPCLALMVPPRRVTGRMFHVGVYVDRRIMHIHERGVEYMPVDVVMRGFLELRFYK